MDRGKTGEWVATTTAGGETVRAFVPHPLPPNPVVDLSGSLGRRLERAQLALGRVDSISLLLPDPHVFVYAYVRREAVLSSQIEGTQSSLADLLLFEAKEAPGVPIDDVIEVSNYVAALEHGARRLQERFPLCNRLLREIHEMLLSSGRGSEKCPGEFRRSQNWIGGTRPGNAHFVPPPPEQVADCMAALERFLNDESTPYPTVVKAALAHVQFETIHPFLDGNGRIGRLLISLILYHDAVLSRPLLYLSLYFKRHRGEYYRLLDRVREKGDWEAWLEFFLDGVEGTAKNAVQTARKLVSLFQEDTAGVSRLGRAASSALRVYQVLRERPIVSVPEACRRTGLSFPTVNQRMDDLVRLGIARELTGRRRNRTFAYDRYLAILNEGVEGE